MGKIRKRVDPYVLTIHGGQPLNEGLRYIETGDPSALDAIKRSGTWQYWRIELRKALDPPSRCDEEDRRALHVLARGGGYAEIADWVCQELPRERPEQDLHRVMRDCLAAGGLADQEIAALTAAKFREFHKAGQPNSAGRYILGLSDQELRAAVSHKASWVLDLDSGQGPFEGLIELLFSTAPERLDVIVPSILDPKRIRLGASALLLEKGGQRFEDQIVDSWRHIPDAWMRFVHSKMLIACHPARYRAEVLAICRADLAAASPRKFRLDEIMLWMISTYGGEVLEDALHYIGQVEDSTWAKCRIMTAAVQRVGREALPLVLLLLKNDNLSTRKEALTHLIELDDGTHGELIRSTLEAGIEEARDPKGPSAYWQPLVDWIKLAGKWRPALLTERLWPLSGHKSRPAREAAARALGRIGEDIVPRAVPLLQDKKADRRAWAVTLLSTVGSRAALDALEARIDVEADEEVRDAMLLALDAARAAAGKEVTREEISGRVNRAAKKLGAPVASWLDESRLPPLRYADGTALGLEATRFLLYRQSRAREMRPDVEARPLYALIDRKAGADFALELFSQFTMTKADASDRWVLAVTGLLGDDRAVPGLNSLIQHWGDSARGKMAEYGVQALALLGTDAALTMVDALALRYRTKNKNIGAAAVEAFAEAAARRGLTIDELGDMVVPWLGFTPGQPRVVDCGGKPFQVTVGPDFKLAYRDIEKNKPAKSLPRSAPEETLAQLKNEAALLKDVAKGQVARIENLMVRQHRWPADRWRALFLDHPVLFPFATRLAWGAYGPDLKLTATFRALEDGSLTTPTDEPFDLAGATSIGILHPLELDDETRAAWQTHLADYEISPPFPQLDRPVLRVSDDQRPRKIGGKYRGTSLNAMTFRGRAEKLGWTRGSVNDGGCIDAYRKVFPGAGVEAFLGVDGLYMGIGMDQSVTLEDFAFVRAGSVQVGSYVYDTPSNESDARLIPFGSVPPVVFSEVMGDLARIAGQPSGGADGSSTS